MNTRTQQALTGTMRPEGAPSPALPCNFRRGSMAAERQSARVQINPGALLDTSRTWHSGRSNHVPDFQEATILAEA